MSKQARAIQEMFTTVSLGSPENAVGFVLWRLVHRYQRELDRSLARVNLTHLQFQTLAMCAWLARADEPVSQAGLARAADIQPMQVSNMLAALEGKGFAIRSALDTDVRAKRVQVTTAGLAALRRALPVAIAVQSRLFGTDAAPGGPLHVALLALLGNSDVARTDDSDPTR